MYFAYSTTDDRLYLMDSPVVRADTLCFRAQGVREIVRFNFDRSNSLFCFVIRVFLLSDVLRPWFNGYRYFVQMATAYSYVIYYDYDYLLYLIFIAK